MKVVATTCPVDNVDLGGIGELFVQQIAQQFNAHCARWYPATWNCCVLATLIARADVAELVDAHGSGPCARKGVEVQVLSSASLARSGLFPGVAALAAALGLAGAGLAAGESRPHSSSARTEVVVSLKAPPLAIFGRAALSPKHAGYAASLAASQRVVANAIKARIPSATIRWRYRIVFNGMAVVVPRSAVGALSSIDGVTHVYENTTYPALTVRAHHITGARARTLALQGPTVIGADKLWGTNLQTAGNGMKIGVIDDGIDSTHTYFAAGTYSYPAGFPKGQTSLATPKVIVQRAFAPAGIDYAKATTPYDSGESFHATHVAGIAAGDHNTPTGSGPASGVAPNAYLGNYKALSVPTPEFELDGNAAELAAAVEAAVADGMNVINLSLGEPEVEPTRDLVVAALNAASRVGVVPVVAAGNDFSEFGSGSIGSPSNASGAIAVAATTEDGTIADFSSGGPTPVSQILKPDVSAPGVAITSSLPTNEGGPWGQLDGTSMATPHVAGAIALLLEQHPDWTFAQVKSSLVITGSPVRGSDGREVSVLREGGGLIDLPKANTPLLFANPSTLTLPRNGGVSSVALSDAGGGAGTWSVSVTVQNPLSGATVTAPPTVGAPGSLAVTATVAPAASSGYIAGFVVLSNGTATRRIPFLTVVSHPVLAQAKATLLPRTGTYSGTTVGGTKLVRTYRYPTGSDGIFTGPEVVYRVHVGRAANFGVAVTTGDAVPHVVYNGDENHLTGYTALPIQLNPYKKEYGARRLISAAVLPLAGTYEIVFDTPAGTRPGPFTFRYWVNDTTPPKLRVVPGAASTITVAATDLGSGIDPSSIVCKLDGKSVTPTFADGTITIPAATGSHALDLTVSDYQETKNMEDVVKILPNTTTLSRLVHAS